MPKTLSNTFINKRCWLGFNFITDNRIEFGDYELRLVDTGESSIMDIFNLGALHELKTWYLDMNHYIYLDHNSNFGFLF